MTATLTVPRWDALLARAKQALDEFEARAPIVRRTREFLAEHQTLLLMLVILKWAIGLLVAKWLLVG
jgi:hypothetical protein